MKPIPVSEKTRFAGVGKRAPGSPTQPFVGPFVQHFLAGFGWDGFWAL